MALLLFVLSNTLFADSYFTHLRFDQTVPEHCEEMSLSFFNTPAETFYVGRAGALEMGFTFEYPVKRHDANLLWKYFRGLAKGEKDAETYEIIQNNPELKRDHAIIINQFEKLGFDFGSEGEILEVLAIHDLYQEFPENIYFITGGVEYHESYFPQTIGEVDIFVGRRTDCSAAAVGEVKLGKYKALQKAKKQLKRFEDFLIDHGASSFKGLYNKSRRRTPQSFEVHDAA